MAPFWIKQLFSLCSLLIKMFPDTEQKTDAVWGTNSLYCYENSNLAGLTTEVCMHLCSSTEAAMPCMTCRGQETIEIYVHSVRPWKTQLLLLPVRARGSNEERSMEMTPRDVGRATETQEYRETTTTPSWFQMCPSIAS